MAPRGGSADVLLEHISGPRAPGGRPPRTAHRPHRVRGMLSGWRHPDERLGVKVRGARTAPARSPSRYRRGVASAHHPLDSGSRDARGTGGAKGDSDDRPQHSTPGPVTCWRPDGRDAGSPPRGGSSGWQHAHPLAHPRATRRHPLERCARDAPPARPCAAWAPDRRGSPPRLTSASSAPRTAVALPGGGLPMPDAARAGPPRAGAADRQVRRRPRSGRPAAPVEDRRYDPAQPARAGQPIRPSCAA
jgi:hypothetical protein